MNKVDERNILWAWRLILKNVAILCYLHAQIWSVKNTIRTLRIQTQFGTEVLRDLVSHLGTTQYQWYLTSVNTLKQR